MEISEWPQIEEIVGLVESKFLIIDKYFSEREIIFIIDEKTQNIKGKFQKLYEELRPQGYYPTLRKEDQELILRVIKGEIRARTERRITFYALMFVTIAIIFLDGYLRTTSPIWKTISKLANINIHPLLYSILFVISLFGIVGIHEIGHLIVLKRRKIKASLPYFIPGIPLIMPTFGAIIFQKEPAMNRDALFDLGVSGPVMGLFATIVVTIFALNTMIPITPAMEPLLKGAQYIPPPILFIIIVSLLKPELFAGRGVYLDPIGWAAIVGMFVTFLNSLPAWELDGGHMARAVLGPRLHRLATFITVIIMTIAGFLPMALFILIFWMSTGGASTAPLDDYSPISKSRKIIFVIVLILTFLCMPVPAF